MSGFIIFVFGSLALFGFLAHDKYETRKTYEYEFEFAYSKVTEWKSEYFWTDAQELQVEQFLNRYNPTSINEYLIDVSAYMVENGMTNHSFRVYHEGKTIHISPEDVKKLGGYYETPYHEKDMEITIIKNKLDEAEAEIAQLKAENEKLNTWVEGVFIQPEPKQEDNGSVAAGVALGTAAGISIGKIMSHAF